MKLVVLFLLFLFNHLPGGITDARASIDGHREGIHRNVNTQDTDPGAQLTTPVASRDRVQSTSPTAPGINDLVLTVEEENEDEDEGSSANKKQTSLTSLFQTSGAYRSNHHAGCSPYHRPFHQHLSYSNTARFIAQRSLRI